MARESSRANALLVELLLVIFFFMISAVILVQWFASARHKSLQATAATTAISEAQNCAEELYAAGKDWESWLHTSGFTPDGTDKWARKDDGYTLFIAKDFEPTESGVIQTFRITGFGDGKDLFTIPSTRYIPKEVSP